MTIEILFLFLAGITAGLVTGLFGGSATLTAVPILVVFAGYHPYVAIGVALAVDVFSSFAALYVYHSHNNVDIKPAIPLFSFAVIGVLIGSIFSVNIPAKGISMLVGIGISFASIRFINNGEVDLRCSFFNRHGHVLAAVWGFVGGLVLGVFGGGGGVVMLLALTLFLGYHTHTAIGTSIFGMILIALGGAAGHYYHMPFTFMAVIVGGLGGILGAIFSSRVANHLPEKWLNRIVAVVLVMLGVGLFLKGLGIY